ncbi:M3 family metallopeptidase [Leeia oryzae]|uniref:M3 family metallopeptidase n=1 Tax=Leeia oryzae TaxID=356662 RepID=UPI00036C5FEB|nr:M3 family metallopeptidase [Leeia oryzae]
MSNPLLQAKGLPRFSDIKAEHVTPAVQQLLADAEQTIATLTTSNEAPTWDAFIEPLDVALERLSRAWGVAGHLNAVMNTPELRAAYNENLPLVTEFYTRLGQNEALYARYKQLVTSPWFEQQATLVQRRFLENEIRDFRLSGAELNESGKARFAEIQAEMAELGNQFSNQLLDATDAFAMYVEDATDLAGIPEDVLEMYQQAAEEEGKTGYKLTLQMPFYLPLMQYGENRALRETLYRAYVTRASEFGDPALDNGPLMARLLTLRQEESALLGFDNFAGLSLESKMADSAEEVMRFLADLGQKAKPFAEKDMAELKAFARTLGLDDMQMWDVPFVSEKLRQQAYDFSEQEVRRYLPEDKVLGGLFGVVETLFSVKVVPTEAEVWHPTVRFFSLVDRDQRVVGQFYLDLYARAGKRGGAWMDDAITRCKRGDEVQIPVAYLVCNFPSPVGNEPAYFSFDDVTTLFHEFGHGLHHMLTEVDVRGVAGINGVEWDAVELPSQFMENFCWEWSVLEPMTAHADTGVPMPKALFDKMLAAKNFQSGMQMVRQLEFSMFDMLIHDGRVFASAAAVQQVLDQVRSQVAVAIPPAYNRFPNSFGHIFGGGYAAGYYSYKWAEVLSADAFSAFEEEGVLNATTGQRFRQHVLAVGGGRPAMESFVAFRGRKPEVAALLRHNGLSA